MAKTKERVEGDIEKYGGVEVWSAFVVETSSDIIVEVVLTIVNLLLLTSQW